MIRPAARLRHRLGELEHSDRCVPHWHAPAVPAFRQVEPVRRPDAERPFTDREEAGQLLGEALQAWAGEDDVTVLGIPNGGVPVAAAVARALEAPLSTWTAKKLRAPADPLHAIGSVAQDGEMMVDEPALKALRVPHTYLLEEVRRQRQEVARRSELYRQAERSEPLHLAGRRVVLVDDGMASGATMRAALRGVRRQRPKAVVVAVPVSTPAAAAQLAREATELVALRQPTGLRHLGRYYVDFTAVTDEEVWQCLAAYKVPVRRWPLLAEMEA